MERELNREKRRSSLHLIYVVAGLNLLIGIYQGIRTSQFLSLFFCICLSSALVILTALYKKNIFTSMLIAVLLMAGALVLELARYEMVGFLTLVVRMGLILLLVSGIIHLLRDSSALNG